MKKLCSDFYEHLRNFGSVSSIKLLVVPQCEEADSDVVSAGDNPECYKPTEEAQNDKSGLIILSTCIRERDIVIAPLVRVYVCLCVCLCVSS